MNSKVIKIGRVSEQQAHDFEVLLPLLKSMYDEFQEFSKKKPQDAVSPNKVKVTNRILAPILELLEGEPERQYLNLLDNDDLPQNSDAVLMLGQAVAAMQSFRTKYRDGYSGWRIASTNEK
jgi:hypothetical protein